MAQIRQEGLGSGDRHLRSSRRDRPLLRLNDGQVRKFDEYYYLQRFTPRRPRSKWSKINRQKVTELIERGAMKPAEFRAVLTENGALVPFHRAVFDKLGEDLV